MFPPARKSAILFVSLKLIYRTSDPTLAGRSVKKIISMHGKRYAENDATRARTRWKHVRFPVSRAGACTAEAILDWLYGWRTMKHLREVEINSMMDTSRSSDQCLQASWSGVTPSRYLFWRTGCLVNWRWSSERKIEKQNTFPSQVKIKRYREKRTSWYAKFHQFSAGVSAEAIKDKLEKQITCCESRGWPTASQRSGKLWQLEWYCLLIIKTMSGYDLVIIARWPSSSKIYPE